MSATSQARGRLAQFFVGQTFTEAELRRFGIGMGAGVALIFGLLRPWLRHYPMPYWPWVAAILLWLTALIHAQALSFALYSLNQIGRGVAWLVTFLLCALVYYGVFTPVGWAMRALGRDPMRRRFEPALPSYRIASRQRSRESMERPF
jgi:hypothetical protein